MGRPRSSLTPMGQRRHSAAARDEALQCHDKRRPMSYVVTRNRIKLVGYLGGAENSQRGRLSVPWPPAQRSIPAPPFRMSLPRWPKRRSSPVAPLMRSSPIPPSSRSLPGPPTSLVGLVGPRLDGSFVPPMIGVVAGASEELIGTEIADDPVVAVAADHAVVARVEPSAQGVIAAAPVEHVVARVPLRRTRPRCDWDSRLR